MALLRMTPSAVVAMDAEGRITALNPAAERLLSTSAEAALGRPYPEVFGPSLADRMTKLAVRAQTAEASAPREVEATLPDGRRAKLRASAGPLYEDGLVRGFVFVADMPEPSDREIRLGEALRRYVGDQVAASVDARASFVGVGGTRQVVSVLHADVRGYTTVQLYTSGGAQGAGFHVVGIDADGRSGRLVFIEPGPGTVRFAETILKAFELPESINGRDATIAVGYWNGAYRIAVDGDMVAEVDDQSARAGPLTFALSGAGGQPNGTATITGVRYFAAP